MGFVGSATGSPDDNDVVGVVVGGAMQTGGAGSRRQWREGGHEVRLHSKGRTILC